MNRDERTSGSAAGSSSRLLALFGALFLISFGLGAGNATAFTQTIVDIEDPAVTAKVLDLDVEASRSLQVEHWYTGEMLPEPRLLSSENWGHQLSGSLGDDLTEDQLPRITVSSNPTVVSLAGDLVTGQVQGSESYTDFEHCVGSRTTTKSPHLTVSLGGFYQSGTSSSTGNPEIGLATQNLDPWTQTCSSAAFDTTTRITSIRTLAASGSTDSSGSWSPGDGDLVTTNDGCSATHCDFTITGNNTNSSSGYIGTATGEFTLRLRLEYPVFKGTKVPDTIITKKPAKVVKTQKAMAKAAIGFKSTGPKATKFKCRLDSGSFKPCSSTFKRRVTPGKHRFAVAAVYKGKADKSPAVYSWKVQRTTKSK